MNKQLTTKLLKHFKRVTDNSLDSRPILQCVYYNSDGSVSATDSHRLIHVKNFHQHEEPFALNLSTLEMNQGNYPNVDHLLFEINEELFHIKIDAEELKGGIRAFGSSAKLGLKMTFKEESVVLEPVSGNSTLKVMIDANVKNKGFDFIGFNGMYLLDALMFATDFYRKTDDKVVTLYFDKSNVRSFYVIAKSPDYKYLVTPLRTY